MTLIIFQLYLIVAVLFLAGKDASSYLLKIKTDGGLTASRIQRWHRDGVMLWVLFLLPLAYQQGASCWKISIAWVLIRASLFDLGFNKWAGLPIAYLGGTAWWDMQMVKVFGLHGALTKSLLFFVVLLALNVLNHYL